MNTGMRAAGRRLLTRLAPTAMESIADVPRLRRELARLRRRLTALEAQIQETRRLHQRVAELTDVMAEVLVPVADRDDARVQKALASFARTLS